MNDSTPNYEEYSLEDLRSVLSHIDREKYPDRVMLVKKAIERGESMGEQPQEKIGMSGPELTVFLIIEIIVWAMIIIAGASYF